MRALIICALAVGAFAVMMSFIERDTRPPQGQPGKPGTATCGGTVVGTIQMADGRTGVICGR